MDSRIPMGVSLVAILSAPWLGSLSVISNPMVRLSLLVFLLYSIHVSELSGLLAVLAVVSLISEQNYTKITGIKPNVKIPTSKPFLLNPQADTPVHTELTVQEEVYQDSNPRLPSAPTGARSAQFYMDKKLSV